MKPLKCLFFLIFCLAHMKGSAQSNGGSTSGAFAYCDSSNNGGFISLTNFNGSVLNWESSTDGGATWININNTLSVQSYSKLSKTTCYRAVVKDGTFPPSTSTSSCITIYTPTIGGAITGGGLFCDSTGTGSLSLSGNNGNILYWEYSVDKGTAWTKINNTTNQLSYSNITQNTLYKAMVQNGSVCKIESSATAEFIISPSIGGTINGGGKFCSESGSGTLLLTGNIGNVLYWESSIDGGLTWNKISNTTTILNYASITQNTTYRAIVRNGSVCPADTSSPISFIIEPSVAGNISGSDSVCFRSNGDTLRLSGNHGSILNWLSSVNSGVSWNVISNTTSSLPYKNLEVTTLYKSVVKNGTCDNDTSHAATIFIFPKSYVNAGKDTTIIKGTAITLNGNGQGVHIWSPAAGLSNPLSYNPAVTPNSSTTYVLEVRDQHNCYNSDTVVITVHLPEFNGKVSNLFTPNGDGINDSWYLEDIQNYPENEVFVYNIYGSQVYSKKGYTNEWQGTYNGADLPDGTYYYVVRFGDSEKIIKGSLDLLRK